ncbi:MAG: zinc-dependent metalloprotease [Bdellovibrio sp.]|nr:zinc-dependent metalloprotease [Bdellovibrio sp.]
MNSYKILVLASVVAFSFGCQKNRLGIDPTSEHRASAKIADSFFAQTNLITESDLAVDQAHVVIKKVALDKEFLLSSNILWQTPTPAFSSLQSRVISFILRDHKVYLMDVTGNHKVGVNNIPQNLLLAEFNILSESTNSLVIDFNTGMKNVFTAGDMYASDDGSADADYNLPTAKVGLSYLDEVVMHEDTLFIRQVAQLETVSEKQETKSVPVEVRYQIKPYLPDTSFTPVKSPGFTKIGYFEANPLLLKDGTSVVYATKWDDKKPMVFAISANTPVKYRDLVRNGILYWNKVLGKDKITVVQLTDATMTAPAFDQNIIQWVDYDGSGAAFADMQIDPRSGQVTSAQVYIPSAFTESLVPKRVRLNAGQDSAKPTKQLKIGLKGFSFTRVCNRNINNDLATMDLADITPAAMDKAMRDYVYEVVAHEVGHVMGLRHNFAGNLASNYDWDQRKEFVMSYYRTQTAPNLADGTPVVTSSSVMEYSRFEESSWNGDRLQKANSPALTYDQMAMNYLYFGTATPDVRPAFCTDSHVAIYADCNMSDAGRSVVSSSLGAYQFNLDTLAARMINLYISKSKYADDLNISLIPVSEVDLNAKTIIKTMGIDFAKFVSLLKADVKLIAVRSAAMPILATNIPVMHENEKAYLQSEVNRFGGLTKVLAAFPNDYDTQLQTHFAELLANPYYNSGTTRDGKPYSFTTDEKKIMINQVAIFSTQMKNEFILNEIKALSGDNFSFEQSYGQAAAEDKTKWADSDLTTELAQVQLSHFNHYALTHALPKISTDVVLKDGSRSKVELPTYLFPQTVRAASARLFSSEALAIDWAYFEKQQAVEMMQDELSLLGAEDKIDKASLTKEALKWLLFNKQIESTLAN